MALIRNRLARSISTVLLVLAANGGASAQCTSWDTRFASWIPNGAVNALVLHDDGSGSKLYAGGAFTAIGPQPLAYLARWTGGAWEPVGGALDGAVVSLFVHDFGSGPRLVAGGSFANAGGVPASRVAVWDGASWSALGAGFDAPSYAFATYDDGGGPALHAGGQFLLSGGTQMRHIAKWSGSTWSEVGGGADSSVYALQPRFGTLYVGGAFSAVGMSAIPVFAAWNGSFWTPPSFDVPNAPVYALRVHTDLIGSHLFVGGGFGHVGMSNTNRVARYDGGMWNTYPFGLLPDDTLCFESFHGELFAGFGNVTDSSAALGLVIDGFQNAIQPLQSQTHSMHSGVFEVRALRAVLGAGGDRLYAGGMPVGGFPLLPREAAANPLSSWDGERWSVVSPSLALRNHAGVRPVVRAFTRAAIGGAPPALFAVGGFDQAGMQGADTIVRWTGAGWSPLPGGTPPFVRDGSGALHAVCAFDDGGGTKLVVGGEFDRFDIPPAPSWHHLASWDGTSWSALGDGTDLDVNALEVFDEGSGARLFAVGAFTQAGGNAAAHIARWNGSAWSALGGGVDGAVHALCTHDDGGGLRLYAGGEFANAGGATATAVARWDGLAWSAVGTGLAGRVRCLEVLDEGHGVALYAGGRFTNLVSGAIEGVARWDGAGWTLLGLPVIDRVDALCVHDDGSGRALYAFGRIASGPGGTTIGAKRWASPLWTDAATIAITVPAADPLARIHAATSFDDGSGSGPALLVGGDFTSVDGVESLAFAVQKSCRITSFCAGDGLDPAVTTDCPCGNFGTQGRGCAWHAGPSGALLVAQGAIAPADELVLVASGMPASATAIFLAGNAEFPTGEVFGDGVRCVAGSLTRMGMKINVAGSSRYPEAGNAPISVRGNTPVGSGLTGDYQTYYRNAAAFCTSATFNATNGVRVVW